MKFKNPSVFLSLFLALSVAAPLLANENPRSLVEAVVEANGGKEAFYSKGGVEYTYIYRDAEGKEDISKEKYLFDGELSWAVYEKMEKSLPDMKEPLLQGYDGKTTWAFQGGEPVTDPQILRRADFLRKTNYYWFSMMFKLLDDGLTYEYLGRKKVDGVNYHKVKVGFGKGIGDVQDTYVLFINPKTNLVDQFLFTVMDFDRKDPLLMRVTYKKVDGILIPAYRKYAPAKDWEGDPAADKWVEEISKDIQFTTELDRSLFSPPSPKPWK